MASGKSTKEWKKLVKNLHGKHAKRMDDLLETLNDKEFRIVYVKLLEYTQPKLQRKEIAQTNDKGSNVLQINVVNNIQDIARLKEETIDITPENESDES